MGRMVLVGTGIHVNGGGLGYDSNMAGMTYCGKYTSASYN
jgi:hypothetical protein